MDKRPAGFKFGTKSTKLIRACGELQHNGRTYRLVLVEADGQPYYSLRLYNARGRFIKQLMFEPEIIGGILGLLSRESQEKILGENSLHEGGGVDKVVGSVVR